VNCSRFQYASSPDLRRAVSGARRIGFVQVMRPRHQPSAEAHIGDGRGALLTLFDPDPRPAQKPKCTPING